MSGQDARPNEPGEVKKPGAAPTLADDGGMPGQLVFWGIAVGLLLTAGGAVVMALLPHMASVGALMTCVGFGIVLAAFGSRVVGTWRNWSIVGSGAMAVVLFLLLQEFAPPPAPVVPFVYGHLRGTEKMEEVTVAGQNSYLVGRVNPGSHWEFFARKEALTGDIFAVTVKPPNGVLPNPIIIGCLQVSLLKEQMGNPDGLDLSLIPDSSVDSKQQWLLVRTGKSTPLGVFGNPLCPVDGRTPLKISAQPGNWLVGTAIAQPAPLDSAAVFKGLNADSLSVQGQAQDMVARLRGPDAIQPLVREWKPPVWNDRLDTGLLVAWVKGTRQTRDVVVPIASALTREQLNHIVELTGNSDRTTRYNAAEMLSWLLQSTAWPNPPPAEQIATIVNAVLGPFTNPETYTKAISSGREADIGNISFNTLVALQDAKCDMRAQDRDGAVALLEKFEAMDYIRKGNFARTTDMSKQFRMKACK